MDNLSNDFKSLKEIDFPETLHSKIMKKLIYRKLKTPFFTLFSLLSLNLIILIWRLWLHIEQINMSFTILSPIIGSFELSYEYFSDLLYATIQFLPLAAIFTALINIIILVYIYRIRLEFIRSSTNV